MCRGCSDKYESGLIACAERCIMYRSSTRTGPASRCGVLFVNFHKRIGYRSLIIRLGQIPVEVILPKDAGYNLHE